MKVLVLTNPAYKDFVDSVVAPFQSQYNLILNYVGIEKIENWDDLNGIGYDIGISFMYQYKVPAKELSHTWFNFHPAPLPEYKGRNLCYHAIMNGEKEFGASLHYMDENFDTGDIIEVGIFSIQEGWSAGDLSAASIAIAKGQFMNYFPRIISGEKFERLPNVGGVYYKKDVIIDTVKLTEGEPFGQFVRAVTYGDFYPKIDIGGVKYKIVRDE